MNHPAPKTPWLPALRSSEATRMRLFCLPYAGGMSAVFNSWSTGLPREIAISPIELPGRGSRISEPKFEALAPLVKAMVNDLLPYLDKPFALFGHSLGALICFEFARALLQGPGISPLRLFVAGHSAPHLSTGTPPRHALPDHDLLHYLEGLNGTPQTLLEDSQLMALMLPIIRADLSIFETHTHVDGPPLICPITAFGGAEDPEVTMESLQAWRLHTRSTFDVKIFPGDHFFLHTQRQAIVTEICRRLEFSLTH
jgi:surfactin synthase thioesterase subunit